MEDILDIYHRPYDSEYPMVCMDEQPVQLLGDIYEHIPPKPNRAEIIDYEYSREGTADIFMFTEPLNGWRKVNVRERRTKIDWAMEIKELVCSDYPNAKKIILVCDNLNTHTIGSLYTAFPPEEAFNIAKRLEIHYTPKHGSWLNIAEIELSAISRQCLDRRIPNIDELRRQTKIWQSHRNDKQKSVDWQFSTGDARVKLRRLYPQV